MRKRSLAVVVAVTASVTLGGFAVATASSPATTGCVDKKTLDLRVAHTCKKSERTIKFGAQGPAGFPGNPGATGAVGLTGPRGASGASGTVQFIDANGHQVGKRFEYDVTLIGSRLWNLDTVTGKFSATDLGEFAYTSSDCSGTEYLTPTDSEFDSVGAATYADAATVGQTIVPSGPLTTLTASSFRQVQPSGQPGACQSDPNTPGISIYKTTSVMTPPASAPAPVTLG